MKQFLLASVFLLASGVTAQAQQGVPAGDPMPATAAAVPAPVPVAPAAAAPALGYGEFPQLPPAKPCSPKDVQGFWRMAKVYEQPLGMVTRDHQAEPFQYMHLRTNSTYRIVKSTKAIKGRKNFYNRFKDQEGDPLQQYLVHDKGFIYFYNSGTAVDTQACFIVSSAIGGFKQGQMLLMPPAPQDGVIKSRLLKVYDNISPKKKGKKKKKK